MSLNNNMLIVPMKVEALVVGKESIETDYSGAMANFQVIDYTPVGNHIQTPPFSKSYSLEEGVHIHWILPDALTHGEQDEETGEVVYEKVPTRWLVTRIATYQPNTVNASVSTKSFIVESNYLDTKIGRFNERSSAIPVMKESSLEKMIVGECEYKQNHMFIGRAGEYGSLSKGEYYLEGLTAVGYGEPMYNAYYPNCRNVFGFHDKLEGIREGSSIDYQICGWYDDDYVDPFYGLRGNEIAVKLEKMNLKLSKYIGEESLDNVDEELRILCTGRIYSVKWEGINKHYSTGIPKQNPDIAVGNSSAEAFAALIAKEGFANENIENILNMYIQNLTCKWAEVDGLIDSENKLHEKLFESVQEGKKWIVKKRPKEECPDSEAVMLLDEFCAKKLDVLNKLQDEYEARHYQTIYIEKNTYFEWHRYAIEKDSKEYNEQELEKRLTKIKEYLSEIIEQKQLLNECLEEITIIKDEVLKHKLTDTKSGKTALVEEYYRMVECVPERYWIPNEPVILFSGEGIAQNYNYNVSNGLDEDGMLECREVNQLVSSIRITDITAEIDECLNSYGLDVYVKEWNSIPNVIQKILSETMLLSNSFSMILAQKVLINSKRPGVKAFERESNGQYVLDEDGKRRFEDVIEYICSLIITKQSAPWQALYSDMGVSVQELAEQLEITGVYPARIGMNYWENKWNPLYVEWGVEYNPDLEVIKEDATLSNWELEDIDYTSVKEIMQNESKCTCRGRMLLTPHVTQSVKETIKGYMEDLELEYMCNNNYNPAAVTNEELKKIQNTLFSTDETYKSLNILKDNIKNMDILSQRLYGFNHFLISEQNAIHLKMEYFWNKDKKLQEVLCDYDKEVIDEFLNDIDEYVDSDPCMDNIYSPVRAGYLDIQNLQIVDSFGRIKIICDEQGYTSKTSLSMAQSIKDSIEESLMVLPPRIVEPARIKFDWISAKINEITTNAASISQPIFGWLVPNYLDTSLGVYDEDGTALGSFITVKNRLGNSVVRWMNTPGSKMIEEIERFEIPSNINNELYSFLTEFIDAMNQRIAKDSMVLNDFVVYLSDELTGISVPNAGQKKNLLNFIGRPLALAKVRMRIETMSPWAQKQSWNLDQEQYNPLNNIKFPILIGDERKSGDGLIGFFKHDTKSTYKKFYTYHNLTARRTGFINYDNTVYMKCNEDIDKNTFTFLFDPMQKISITSGILPVKKISIDDALVSNSLGELNVELLVNPLITSVDKISMPLAEIAGKEWSFVHTEITKKGNSKIKTYVRNGDIIASTPAAFANVFPYMIRDGWLRLDKIENDNKKD